MEKKTTNEIAQAIATMTPQQLIQYDKVADRFKLLYQTIHGKKDGERFYEAEKFHFLKIINENAKVGACSKMSLYGCFMDMAVNGLSFDPAMKHVYIVPFNHNIGTKNDPKWESRASMIIGAQGELLLRVRSGQIKYADNPILVYEGDLFKFGTRNDKVFVEHEAAFPRKSEKIMASYIRITRNDDTVDYKVLSIQEIENFRKFSKDKDSKAWTDGLPGMVQSKTIKHAFRSYPKVRMGDFSQLASQIVEQEAIEEAPNVDYGLNGKTAKAPITDQEAFEPETPAAAPADVNFGSDDDAF